ncbi:MAG: hypothetical protein NUV56_03795 [Candidatus Uhrbacteria bacterium]|nr:hypothetical protein [Candidatus Uhrbacteria bacterium]
MSFSDPSPFVDLAASEPPTPHKPPLLIKEQRTDEGWRAHDHGSFSHGELALSGMDEMDRLFPPPP